MFSGIALPLSETTILLCRKIKMHFLSNRDCLGTWFHKAVSRLSFWFLPSTKFMSSITSLAPFSLRSTEDGLKPCFEGCEWISEKLVIRFSIFFLLFQRSSLGICGDFSISLQCCSFYLLWNGWSRVQDVVSNPESLRDKVY